MTTSTITGFYGNNNEAEIFVYETSDGYWYAVDGSHNVNCTRDKEILTDGCNIELLEDYDNYTSSFYIDSEESLVNSVDGVTTDFTSVIDSFLKGQYEQMCSQFDELDSYDFVHELQDSVELNDKQKITILGRLLRDNA